MTTRSNHTLSINVRQNHRSGCCGCKQQSDIGCGSIRRFLSSEDGRRAANGSTPEGTVDRAPDCADVDIANVSLCVALEKPEAIVEELCQTSCNELGCPVVRL